MRGTECGAHFNLVAQDTSANTWKTANKNTSAKIEKCHRTWELDMWLIIKVFIQTLCTNCHSTSTGAKQFIILNAKFNLAKFTTVESTIPWYHPTPRLDHTAMISNDNVDNHYSEAIWVIRHLGRDKKLIISACFNTQDLPLVMVPFLQYLDCTLTQLYISGISDIIASHLNDQENNHAGEALEEMDAVFGQSAGLVYHWYVS